jgi:hypothetical protein
MMDIKKLYQINQQLNILSLNLEIESAHQKNKVIQLIADQIRELSKKIDDMIKEENDN